MDLLKPIARLLRKKSQKKAPHFCFPCSALKQVQATGEKNWGFAKDVVQYCPIFLLKTEVFQ
ncbi:hypothetical protein [Avibacterium paragallinarum]|uniref:hypothetical protein n=1 Tax=Avibacterium paragallinarum TaxID=728 RepID=UPI002ED868FD